MVRKANIVQKQELGGGKGCAEVHEIVPEKDLYGHGKLYAKVVLKPNSSVGWHRHVGETEPYYILEGEGIFVDDDGSRTKVGPGDVCTILPGQCHAIENASSCKDLAFMALIHKGRRTPEENQSPIFVILSLWVECSLYRSYSILALRPQL